MKDDENKPWQDPIRDIVGRRSAFEALVWALARTHPNHSALIAAFKENAEILKAEFLYHPVPEVYLESFEKARLQILKLMNDPEVPGV